MENSGIIIELLFLFLGILGSFLLYPLWIGFVYKFQMGEDIRPEGPASHIKKIGTPTMGGMVIVIVMALITLYFNKSRTQTLFPLFIATAAGLLGLFEDFTKVYRKSGLPGFFEYHFAKILRKTPNYFVSEIQVQEMRPVPLWLKPYHAYKEFWRIIGSKAEGGLQSHQKMVIQFGLAGFISYWTYIKLGWDFIWFPLIGNVHVGILYPIFIFLFFIFILNTVSITDGLDGLAGGLSLIAGLCFWTISSVLGYNSLAAFCATFVGVLLPFLYFNIYPARVFMGNVGSHFLGAFMAMLSIVLHREVAFLFIGAVFLFDGFSSPLQQLSVKITKKRIFRMAPFHHHFELLGWPETKVTLRFWIIGSLLAFFGLFIALL